MKTENEQLSEKIISSIRDSQNSLDSQISVRHYLWLSYGTKLGLSIVGYLKLQAVLALMSLGMPIFAKLVGVVL